MTRPSAGNPSDNTTLSAVLESYASEGFDGVFEFVNECGDLCCSTCRQAISADQVPLHSVRRLEGASDPADMLAVCAITCTNCGVGGTVVVTYGPLAAAEEASFLSRARDQRDDDLGPRDSTPDEELPTRS